MSPVVLFTLLMLLCFGVIIVFLKPGQTERAVRRHLSTIDDRSGARDPFASILKPELLSSNPWLHELLSQLPGIWGLHRLIQQAGKEWPASSMLGASLAGAFAGLLVSIWFPNGLLALVVVLVGAAAPFGCLLILRNIRFQACQTQLPDAVDLMARALRAGHAISSALEMVGREAGEPLASEFRTVYEEQSLGLPLRDAMMSLVRRLPSDDIRFLTTALLLQKETGGNLAQILDKTAAVMRSRVRMKGQVKVYTAQARVTGYVICAMPFLLFALISLVSPDYERLLFADPLGMKMVEFGLVMMLIGIFVIRKIIDIRI